MLIDCRSMTVCSACRKLSTPCSARSRDPMEISNLLSSEPLVFLFAGEDRVSLFDKGSNPLSKVGSGRTIGEVFRFRL